MTSSMLITVILVCGTALLANSIEQFKVTGVLKCGDKLYEGAHVKLVDNDSWDSDDDIAELLSDVNGTFTIGGNAADEFGKADPVLKIYHQCDHPGIEGGLKGAGGICDLKFRFRLPNWGNYSKGAVYDFGVYNLESKPGNDHEFNCI